jgi:hypothetical protein
MSGAAPSPGERPLRRGPALSPAWSAFMLFTGPLAWFAQLCIGFALLSWPCFPYDLRLTAPLDGFDWTRIAALILLLACAVLAALSGYVSWSTLAEIPARGDGAPDPARGRARFTALWGTMLGLGFAVATLATLAGFALVPRCAG